MVTPNEYGEVATLATTAGATAIYSEGLTYDAAGRIRVVDEVIQGVPVRWVYGYDKLGRLTSASKNGAPATTWTYDGNGNRITENGVVSTYDAQDRLKTKGTTTYEFDALGGRRLKTEGSGVTRYTHDGLGALTSVTLPDATVIAYDYDARQRRVAKRRNGVVVKRWVYDGQYRVAAEVDGSGVVTSRFVYASQSNSPDYLLRAGATYAYVKNHLGSIVLVVDSGTGAIAQRLDYDPWGNVVGDSAPGFQPFGFAGGCADGDTKLYHMGFRDYDPSTGSFNAKDPLRLSQGLSHPGVLDFESVRLGSSWRKKAASETPVAPMYSYARDNPLLYIDENGLFPITRPFSPACRAVCETARRTWPSRNRPGATCATITYSAVYDVTVEPFNGWPEFHYTFLGCACGGFYYLNVVEQGVWWAWRQPNGLPWAPPGGGN